MKLRPCIIILPLLWWAFDVNAQVSQGPSPVPEQWQLTLDVIKSKAQSLVIENNGLQEEYRQLMGQTRELQQAIDEQQYKNEQIRRFLKERHGRTDQQVRIEELTQIVNTKRRQVQKQEAQASRNTGQPLVDDQLTQLRKQLEDGNKQEVLLENELKSFKTGDRTQILNVDAIDQENKRLEARLDKLRLQKLQHEKKFSDTGNKQMYDKIKGLREDIDILKDQVAKLELRADLLKGQAVKQ